MGTQHPSASDAIKLQRLVEKLHALGARPLLEFLREIDKGADVYECLDRYASLPCEFIRANDVDKFAPSIFALRGGRG